MSIIMSEHLYHSCPDLIFSRRFVCNVVSTKFGKHKKVESFLVSSRNSQRATHACQIACQPFACPLDS